MSLTDTVSGTTKVHTLKGVELVDGNTVDFEVMVLKGIRTGPTLYLGATMHGDEVTGTEIVRRAVELLSPDTLSGTAIAVAVQNPLAFRSRSRIPLSAAVGSVADMYQVFPGKAAGEPVERMAHILFRDVLSRADYVLDLHSGTSGSRNAAYAWVPTVDNKDVVARSVDLARSLGMDFIMLDQLPHRGILHNCLAASGVPALTVELGEGGKIDDEFVEVGVRGVINTMRHLNMLEGKSETYGNQIVIHNSVALRANRGGLLRLQSRLGEYVTQGSWVASVLRPHGDTVERVLSPIEGYVLKTITMPTVMEGERVAVVGAP